jgi:hypothetical protein
LQAEANSILGQIVLGVSIGCLKRKRVWIHTSRRC